MVYANLIASSSLFCFISSTSYYFFKLKSKSAFCSKIYNKKCKSYELFLTYEKSLLSTYMCTLTSGLSSFIYLMAVSISPARICFLIWILLSILYVSI